MAQYLDLTGLSYFKNKLLSSALHFYTGGGTTSNVTFDFGRMKSGSSTKREIYFHVEDADGTTASNNLTINESGLFLSAYDYTQQTANPSIINNTPTAIILENWGNLDGEYCSLSLNNGYNIRLFTPGQAVMNSGEQQEILVDSVNGAGPSGGDGPSMKMYSYQTSDTADQGNNTEILIGVTDNTSKYRISDNNASTYTGSDITLKKNVLTLRAYNANSPSKIILDDYNLHLDNMYLYGGSGTIGAGACVLGYYSILIGTSYGVGQSSTPELERCANLMLGIAGYTNIRIEGYSANINLGTGSGHNFIVTANNFSSGKTNNEAYIKIGSTTITETQLQALLTLLGSTIGTAQVGTATVV